MWCSSFERQDGRKHARSSVAGAHGSTPIFRPSPGQSKSPTEGPAPLPRGAVALYLGRESNLSANFATREVARPGIGGSDSIIRVYVDVSVTTPHQRDQRIER